MIHSYFVVVIIQIVFFVLIVFDDFSLKKLKLILEIFCEIRYANELRRGGGLKRIL